MAKRKRLDPARLIGADAEATSPPPLPRPPIADIAGDAASTAAFEEVAGVLASARAEGRMIQRLPLDAIDTGYLVRDRIALDGEEMDALCASISDRGQQTAIEVADLGADANPRWGLISGWRRLNALRRLRDAARATEGREAPTRFDTVLALARSPAESSETYRAMVEENEIRLGLSFYERARIVARAVDKGVYPDDRAGLAALFASASRAKRSKIGSFVRIVRALDGALRHPTALSERAGLALAKALTEDPAVSQRLVSALEAAPPQTPEAEAKVIAATITPPRPRRKAEPADPLAPDHAPVRIEPQPGGRLILSGPLVADPAFRARLKAWLEDQS